MSLSDKALREHVRAVVMERLEGGDGRREEAVSEFLTVTMGVDQDTASRTAELVPPLMAELYDKWVGQFVERFFETVPAEQIELLCDGSEENNAALCLVYVMFLESARMEEQIPKDLSEYGMKMTGAGDTGDLAASYIRAKLDQLGRLVKPGGSGNGNARN